MSNTSALVRILAALFIVLGISPFTAPFATCDLDLFHGGHQTGATTVKTTTDPDETLAIPSVFHFVAPLFNAVVAALLPPVDSSAKTRISPQVLRV